MNKTEKSFSPNDCVAIGSFEAAQRLSRPELIYNPITAMVFGNVYLSAGQH